MIFGRRGEAAAKEAREDTDAKQAEKEERGRLKLTGQARWITRATVLTIVARCDKGIRLV